MLNIRPNEIANIIRQQIESYDKIVKINCDRIPVNVKTFEDL